MTARPELRSLSDVDLFAAAQEERRVVVTENIGDFWAVVNAADQRGMPHHGLSLVDPANTHPATDARLVAWLDNSTPR